MIYCYYPLSIYQIRNAIKVITINLKQPQPTFTSLCLFWGGLGGCGAIVPTSLFGGSLPNKEGWVRITHPFW
jgi:hypothetical protein